MVTHGLGYHYQPMLTMVYQQGRDTVRKHREK
jgi:hypothetical protein